MTTLLSRSCLLAAALFSAACTSSTSGGSGSTSATTSGGSGGAGGSGGSSTGSSSSSGVGGGGGASCQPASLVGARSAAGVWQMAALDPATGALTTLAPLASVTSFLQAGSAYDSATKRVYLLGSDGANQPTVITVDGRTGATLASAKLPDAHVDNPVVVGGGALLVLHQPSGSWETATLDPALGTLTTLSPLPDNGFSSSRGFDPATNHVFEIGTHNGAGNVFTLDATTGALLLDVPTADVYLDSAVVNGAGALLGLHQAGGGGAWSVARLDPTTGTLTNLAPVTLTGVYSGMGTFDPCTNRLYELTPDGVLTIDGTSGALISLVPLAGEQGGFANLEAVW